MIGTSEDKLNQIQMLCIEDLVPKNHLLRKIEKAIDWSFIYELVEDKYSQNNGRPSIYPVTLIKTPILQYLYGITTYKQVRRISIYLLARQSFSKMWDIITLNKNYSSNSSMLIS